MLAAAIIVFREVIEAGLIVGIVLAATQGVSQRARFVFGGIAAGVLGAALLAVFAGSLSNALSGMGQEVFSASILAVAVVMLAWHNIWMARHGRELAAELKAAGQAVVSGSKTLMALGAVVAIAVLREGAEVVLFLYGIVVANGTSGWGLFAGGILGLAAGSALTALTYFGLVRIPPRYLFGVTTLLLTLLAAGMAAQCVAFLERAGLITFLTATLWDTSAILPVNSILGRVLHTLAGYDDQPSILQAIVYLAALTSILILTRVFAPASPAPKHGVSGAEAQSERLAVIKDSMNAL
jgi:high-affinity iron transporter